MKPTSLVILLFIFLPYKNLAQDQEIDSIRLWVESNENRDSVRVNNLIELTKYYATRDFPKNVELINEALEISEEIGYLRGRGLALTVLSKHYVVKGEIDKALKVALEAKKIIDSTPHKKDIVSINNSLARI